MQIKRFAARSMSEALQKVKAELGPEAIILSARTVKNNGLFRDAFRKPGVEVTAAMDTTQTFAHRRNTSDSSRYRLPTSSPGRGAIHNPYSVESYGAYEDSSHTAEHGDRRAVRLHKDGKLRESWLYRHLIRHEVRQEYALEIASELLAEPKQEEIRNEQLLTSLGRALLKMGIETRSVLATNARRVALVGSAGVGKTACAAKIAAFHAMNGGRKVAMVSLDNYRIAAANQLQRCAEIIGIPLLLAHKPDELRQAFRQLQSCDLILIDTAAICRTDREGIEKLTKDLKLIAADEIHLVCSASRKEKDIVDLTRGLEPVGINRLLFTKLDDTVLYGSLLNLLMQLQLPASGFSHGRQIPSSLEDATIEKLAELILKGANPDVDHRSGRSEMRKKKPRGTEGSRLSAKSFTANKNSHLFHAADCTWTRLIKKDNRVVFSSAAEALARNFKPCRDCCKNIVASSMDVRQGKDRASAFKANGSGRFTKGLSEVPPTAKIPVRSA